MHQKHEKTFKSTGFTKLLSKKDWAVELVVYRDVIFPQFINEFKVKIDNTKCG